MSAISSNVPKSIIIENVGTMTIQPKSDSTIQRIWKNFIGGTICGVIVGTLYFALKVSGIITSLNVATIVKTCSAFGIEGIFVVFAICIIAYTAINRIIK